jgi:hypothetical protein
MRMTASRQHDVQGLRKVIAPSSMKYDHEKSP